MAIKTRDDERGNLEPPAGVRLALRISLALALAVGVYLAAVRGDAILIDLAGLGQFFCL